MSVAVCRQCAVAGYLEEEYEISEDSARPGIAELIGSWHDDCKGCDCTHGGIVSPDPRFGFAHGLAVHLSRYDHLPARGLAQRINKRLAIGITKAIGTMYAAYVFALLSLVSLPAILTQAFHLTVFPGWLISASLIALVAWVSSYFLQLVLLPVIQMGQNIQGEAGDARAAKTFQDTETIVDRLDTGTQGGLQEVMIAIENLDKKWSAH